MGGGGGCIFAVLRLRLFFYMSREIHLRYKNIFQAFLIGFLKLKSRF